VIKLSEDVKKLVNNALADNVPCLLGTVTADGQPQVGPKGSVVFFDDGTLAYWERARRSALSNVGANPHVVIYYRNPGKADLLPRGAALRFHGTATVYENGPMREKIKSMIVKAELDRDPEDKGAGVLVKLDKVTDLQGAVVAKAD
jgi:predicted pyridoxine 5'-phosphate oxidase superfamily flavin-nucleotide-binding protein